MIFSRSTLSTATTVAVIVSGCSMTTMAFAPSNLPFHHTAASSSSLSMSAALIVQNKGGGHGELGGY